jgi:hypothetical protein
MKMTEEEKALAKKAIAKLLRQVDPNLSESDKELLAKYPRHTLEEAREIDATRSPIPLRHSDQDLGFVSGFELLRKQESNNLQITGDHT